MKAILFILFVSLISSCSVYQYTAISSKNLKQNQESFFTDENDSVRIEYNFNKENRPVSIKIFNKTDQPLYIDWQKSAVVTNGKARSLFSNSGKIKGEINGELVQLNNVSTTYQSNIAADLKVQDGLGFLPPHSYLENAEIQAGFLPVIPVKTEEMRKIKINGRKKTAMKKEFSDKDPGNQFQCYLTFIGGVKSERSFSTSHDFYISSVTKTSLKPQIMYKEKIPGNVVYSRYSSGFSQTMGVLGVFSGAIITVAALAGKK